MRVVETRRDGLAECATESGETSEVDLALVDAVPGDIVLVHACTAIQVLA
jgi:hypothetical protein